jgi:WD40 repeat protein
LRDEAELRCPPYRFKTTTADCSSATEVKQVNANMDISILQNAAFGHPFLLRYVRANVRRRSGGAMLRAAQAIVLALGVVSGAHDVIAAGGFVPTGALSPARFGACAALLPNGKVLVAGGDDGVALLASATLYDPVTGTFAATTNNLSVARSHPTCTLLATNKVLIAGGGNYDETGAVANADIYDPSTGMFAATGAMKAARNGNTATLLNGGKVLIAGGIAADGTTRLASAELYDPVAGTFTFTGSMAGIRDVAVAALLQSGKVLIAGGGDGSGVSLNTAELYDPVAGTFSGTGSLQVRRDDATATMLPNGKVLVVGGINNDVPIGSAELYDPASGMFTLSASSVTPRHFATATLLPDNTVLIAGGVDSSSSSSTLTDAALYNYQTDTFTPTGAMHTARYYFTATLLGDGSVLVAGGYNDSGVTATAELYSGNEIFSNGFE